MQNAFELTKNGTVVSKVTNDGDIIGTAQTVTITAGEKISIANNHSKTSGNIILVAVRIIANQQIYAGNVLATMSKTISGIVILTGPDDPQQAYISGDSIVAYKPLASGADIWLYGVGMLR